MTTAEIRVLVTGAGTGSSGNAIRALRAMTPSPYVVGVHHDAFVLRQSLADCSYRCPPYPAPEFAHAADEIVRRERIDVVMPTDDDAVAALSRHRDRFPRPLFLPRRDTIDLCHDKHALATFLRRHGVPAPRSYAVRSLSSLDGIFARFSRRGLLWCRARRGTRSVAATPVASAAQARAWITQWRDLRGVDVSRFTLSDYLPGRHFIVQSVWRDGRVLLVQAIEVLSYFAAANNPSGVFSLSSLAKTVVAPAAVDVSLRAVRALEPAASGTFCVELKESARSQPCVTEINAGRFPSGVTALLAVGKQNMVAVFVLSALGEPVMPDDPYEGSAEYYLVRDIDALPGVYSTTEVLEMFPTTEGEGER